MNTLNDDPELTPTCDPPRRANGEEMPIGQIWWIEPSHPDLDPEAQPAPEERERDFAVGSTGPTRK